MIDRLYRPEQAMTLIGVGRTRLYAMLKSGEIRSVKIGKSRRIPRSAIEEFLQGLDDQAVGQ
ncbi:helix-turn-helix domain-containing protein [Mycobacterium avium]|uniref:helix-turn-helix domain-containing protein n=1 Tax=Mycobacterium avium TaxID=1764 RepID=UPI00191C8FB4|nr:helix-turn-helix domain-containing protein [Mycobacterium avium]